MGMILDLLKGHMPGQLVVQITDRCNATCPQCGMRVYASFERNTIPVSGMEKIIGRAANQGFYAISFTGGEPFLDTPKLLHLIHYAGKAGIPFIRTGTNGFLFRHWDSPDFEDKVKELADGLALSPLRNFWISIDSCEPAVHEGMRGLPGVIRGIEKALPIFHERGLYPSANLGINRNVGGRSTFDLRPGKAFSYEDYLDAFYDTYRTAFHRFYRFVIGLGFTMVNACYPMSLPENGDGGLKAVYSASADDLVVRFTSDEKHRLFAALSETIPHYRCQIRIFSPLCSLYRLTAQHWNGDNNSSEVYFSGITHQLPIFRVFPLSIRLKTAYDRYPSRIFVSCNLM